MGLRMAFFFTGPAAISFHLADPARRAASAFC